MVNQQTDTLLQRAQAGTGRTRSVLVRRTFAATVDQLWTTCTQPDQLARWYGAVSGDARLGGSLHLQDAAATCQVLRCEAPNRLDVSWQSGDETTVVRLVLRPVDDGVELTLEQVGIVSPAAARHGSGWEQELARLGIFLTGGSKADRSSDSAVASGALWDELPEVDDVRWGRADGADSVSIVREFDVAPLSVWDALTTCDGLAGWFGTVTGSLGQGGAWSVAFDDGTASGVVENCVPGLSFRTTYLQGIDAPADVHHVEVTVAEVGAATRLTLVHSFPVGAGPRLRAGMTAGWNAYLAALAAGLAGRPVTDADWMADFRIALIALG
jgi:uncharacterized protein YndB with AHSA1/START domain